MRAPGPESADGLTSSDAMTATGGYETWTTVTATLPAGRPTLRVDPDSNGCNLHYLAFAQS